MRWNIEESKGDKKMEEIIIKTISAFNNGRGGKLLIGVANNGEILGLQDDYNSLKEANKDYFEVHLNNLINSAFGKNFSLNSIKVNFPIIKEVEICEIDIKPSSTPLYVDVILKNGIKQKKFFVRSGNSSQNLDISETALYVQERFKI
jgi:predicted HTH transcriptional regulator